MKIILGSQSKGRKKIMQEMGMPFETMSAHIDEKSIRNTDPKKLTMLLALAKAEALLPKITEPAILITSDQVVVTNGTILEKPQNEKEAREFLRLCPLYPSDTVSAVVATNTITKKQSKAIDIATVYFTPFSEEEIDVLIQRGEVYSLAGGYNIEGDIWENHVKKMVGTRDSILGLPKDITIRLIQEVS